MRKRMVLWMLTLCLLLTGCVGTVEPANPTDPTGPDNGSTVLGYDVQNKYRGVVPGALAFQETEDAFCGMGFMGEILHYYDKTTGISGVLCADPSCTHDSSECGANTDMGGFFYAGEGKAYWIQKGSMDNGWDRTLYKGDLFGTNREKVKVISTQDMIYEYNPQWFVVHRDRLYLQGQKDVVEGVNTYKRITLVSTTLDSSEEYTVLFDEKFDRAVHPYVRFVGDDIYLTLQIFPEGGPFDVKIIKINTKTGETEMIYEETEMPEYIGPAWVTVQGRIYLPGGSDDRAYVWKLENGKRVEVISWATDISTAPTIMDGVAVLFYKNDGIRYAEIADLSGQMLYSGKLFPESIPGIEGDPNEFGLMEIGGDADKIILNLQNITQNEMVDYTVMLDLNNNLEATVLWSNQR